MNWEAIGAIGEVIGAVAVILTLVYLAAQIRQNTRQVENHIKSVDLTSFNAIDESFPRFRHLLAADSELAIIWQRAKQDYLSLPESERERADALIWEWFVIYQNMHHRVFGIVGPGEAISTGTEDQMPHYVLIEIDHPGLRQWWDINSFRFFPDFSVMVTEVYAQGVSK